MPTTGTTTRAPKQVVAAVAAAKPAAKRGTKRAAESSLTTPKVKEAASEEVKEVLEGLRHTVIIEHCKS
jgi:hypothetical protein